ncbi:phosphatidic acid phosphatase type 2D isoform X2 [Hippoglossus stenolepis]|uniref:phosphatidic acid phosphatase type 2D isoform X2 n=1 Tax=Hippoglossus stenolepis TaxID=195615 RepID=UPI00159C52C7|nr:phosphatidic acid phosphatase type 2D isoform X2 [Hippoglossus stenolepis]
MTVIGKGSNSCCVTEWLFGQGCTRERRNLSRQIDRSQPRWRLERRKLSGIRNSSGRHSFHCRFFTPAASIPFFACELKAVTPYRRGFFCGDSSITYPYEKKEAIPDSLLIAGGIIITGLTIALGECYRVRFRGVHSRAFVRNRYVSCLYKELGSFLFGCCVGQSLTNMAKLSVGRLRPNFLSVCNITYALINCTPGSYVPEVTCRQPNHKMEEEARKSFFSGHASFAMYTMLYLAFYLQARLSWRGARLLRPLIQFLLVMIAIYTGLSRISDYRHHPSDVLTGFIQGGLTAYWVAFHISSMFKSCARSDLSPTSMSLESPLSSQQTVC